MPVIQYCIGAICSCHELAFFGVQWCRETCFCEIVHRKMRVHNSYFRAMQFTRAKLMMAKMKLGIGLEFLTFLESLIWKNRWCSSITIDINLAY